MADEAEEIEELIKASKKLIEEGQKLAIDSENSWTNLKRTLPNSKEK